MNSAPAWLPVLGTALVTVVVTLLGWYVRKTDRAAKLTNDNLAQMRESLSLIDDLKRDVWDWEEWGSKVRGRWRELQEKLRAQRVISEVHDLPPVGDDWKEWVIQVRTLWHDLQETLRRQDVIHEVHDLPPVPKGRFHAQDDRIFVRRRDIHDHDL